MVIIFYDAIDEKIYVCSETNRTQVLDINDPELLDYIPNDDILYVQSGHYITKKQFGDWVSGQMNLDGDMVYDYPTTNRFSPENIGIKTPASTATTPTEKERYYIHPTANGTILVEDIKTERYPYGLRLDGKYHFIPIDIIGEDVLDESSFFRTLLARGKLEVVGQAYVNENKHKTHRQVSPTEAALDRILVPADIRAEVAAERGGIHSNNNVAIPIYIDE